MVFRDYELIPTRRVKLRRRVYFPFFRQVYYASGAHYTMYVQSLTVLATLYTLSTYRGVNLYELTPLSFSKYKLYGKIGGAVFGALMFGAYIGMSVYGSRSEVMNLMENYDKFNPEMVKYKRASLGYEK